MNYDYFRAGERLRARRTELGLSREYVAERIDRAEKYYADIERGYCGMSVETLLELADCLQLSVDYILNGETSGNQESDEQDIAVMCTILKNCSEAQRKKILDLAKLYLEV